MPKPPTQDPPAAPQQAAMTTPQPEPQMNGPPVIRSLQAQALVAPPVKFKPRRTDKDATLRYTAEVARKPVEWAMFDPPVKADKFHDALSLLNEVRPTNTGLGYIGAQKAFLTWDADNGRNGIVTSAKVAQYMRHRAESNNPFTIASARKFKSAITDLHKRQEILLQNDLQPNMPTPPRYREQAKAMLASLEHPNTNDILTLGVKRIGYSKARNEAEAYTDPTVGVPSINVITDVDISRMVRNCLGKNTHAATRDAAAYLLTARWGVRAMNALEVRLKHLCKGMTTITDPKRDHMSPLRGLQIFTTGTKTTQMGEKELQVVLRHVDPMLCALGAFARLLVSEWTQTNRTFPRFNTPQQWLEWSVFVGQKDDYTPLTGQQAYLRVQDMYVQSAVEHNKKLGSGRQIFAQVARDANTDMLNLAHGQNRALPGALDRYLGPISIDCIVAQAGASSRRSIHIPRADIKPPAELGHKAFPWLFDAIAEFDGLADAPGCKYACVKW